MRYAAKLMINGSFARSREHWQMMMGWIIGMLISVNLWYVDFKHWRDPAWEV